MRGHRNVHTVYDVMEAKGVFTANRANADAVDPITRESVYERQEFPRMVYHPKGKVRELNRAELVNTPFGPEAVGRQTEMIYRIVKDKAEFDAALAEGWHEHPADAIAAGGGKAPPKSSAAELERLKREHGDLMERLARAEAALAQQDAAKAASGNALTDEDEE